jgi:hypothetical protein
MKLTETEKIKGHAKAREENPKTRGKNSSSLIYRIQDDVRDGVIVENFLMYALQK